MRPQGTQEILENRRRNAIAYLYDGCSCGKVAEIFGVSPRSISKWRSVYRTNGLRGLKLKRFQRKAKLSQSEVEQLREFLNCLPKRRKKPPRKRFYPRKKGFTRKRVMTISKIQKLIVSKFKKTLSRSQVYRIIKRIEDKT